MHTKHQKQVEWQDQENPCMEKEITSQQNIKNKSLSCHDKKE